MIEKATQEDRDEIYRLICELEQEEINLSHFKEVYQRGFDNENIEWIVYRKDHEILGFISLYIHQYLHHHQDTGEIVELVVKPEYRGLRIGDRLICYVEVIARQRGLEELELSTSMYRKKAQLFYEAHGFCKDHFNMTKKL